MKVVQPSKEGDRAEKVAGPLSPRGRTVPTHRRKKKFLCIQGKRGKFVTAETVGKKLTSK